MRKAVIITPFDNYSYEVRIKYVERYFSERGYDVKVISSDFDHRKKTAYCSIRENLELLHVPSYKKNLSYSRIHSHKVFSKKALKRIETINPDIIYCSAPPNFLFKYMSFYKKCKPNVKLIYELGDLWPETLPLQAIIKKLAAPVLNIWAGIRNNNIGFGDGIVYECEMFRQEVEKVHFNAISEVIYLSKEDYYNGNFTPSDVPNNLLRFAYVGSINNIIDIELIVEIMKLSARKSKVELVVIGGGESADRLFSLCDSAGIKYENHGVVFDEEKKHRILSSCQFGLNIMKDSVAVGATMKSLEYFHEGLILINNIKADTSNIVSDYNCGINLENDFSNSLNTFLGSLDVDKIYHLSLNSRKVYEDLFSVEALDKRYTLFLDRVGI